MLTPIANPRRVVPPRHAHARAMNTPKPLTPWHLDASAPLIHFALLVFQGLTNEIPRNFPPLFGLAPSLIHLAHFHEKPPISRIAPTRDRHKTCKRKKSRVSPYVTIDLAALARDQRPCFHPRHLGPSIPWPLFSAYVTLGLSMPEATIRPNGAWRYSGRAADDYNARPARTRPRTGPAWKGLNDFSKMDRFMCRNWNDNSGGRLP